MAQITLTAAEVAAEKYKEWSPDRNDFRFHPDGTCTITPLAWWDDASYARYQGDDPHADDYDMDGPADNHGPRMFIDMDPDDMDGPVIDIGPLN